MGVDFTRVNCWHYDVCDGRGAKCQSCKCNLTRDYYEPAIEPHIPYMPSWPQYYDTNWPNPWNGAFYMCPTP